MGMAKNDIYFNDLCFGQGHFGHAAQPGRVCLCVHIF